MQNTVELLEKKMKAPKGKLKQKLSKIVKKEQVVELKIVKGVISIGHADRLKGEVSSFMVVETSDPRSFYYCDFQTSAGMTDRRSLKVQEVKKRLKKENSKFGVETVEVEQMLYVNDYEYHIEVAGESGKTLAFLGPEEIASLPENTVIDRRFLKFLVVAYGSPSEMRRGIGVYLNSAMISRLVQLEEMGFEFKAFYKKDKKPGYVKIDLLKASKRVKLAASSSEGLAMFQNPIYKGKNTVTFLRDKGLPTEELVEAVHFIIEDGGIEYTIGVYPDFEVLTEEELLVPYFTKQGTVELVTQTELIRRLATDGAAYLDAALARKIGLHSAGSQFRFTLVAKGLGVTVEDLKKDLGVDLLLFDGAVKGDIEAMFEQGVFDFALLNKTRDTEEPKALKVSRQVLSAIGTPAMIDALNKKGHDTLVKLFAFDKDVLHEFIGYKEAVENEEDLEADKEAVDVDNLTVDQFERNPELFVKSAANRNKLHSLLKATTKGLVNGAHMLVDDSTIKHMIVDPYTIVHFLKQGRISASREQDGHVGIRRGRTIHSAMANGRLYLNSAKAVLARFPFLHILEGRLVNADQSNSWAYDKKAYMHYKKAIEKGGYQGLIIYSLWDMNPEGQSGADFDGDTSVVILCKSVVDEFQEQALFLDYSLVDVFNKETGEWKLRQLRAGCPFPGEVPLPLSKVATPNQIAYCEANNITFSTGVLSFPEELSDERELKELMADIMAKAACHTLSGNDIGRYTNINATIMALIENLQASRQEIIAMAQYIATLPRTQEVAADLTQLIEQNNRLKQEIAGYKKLTLLMACGIRWEIDKAKHGGAYHKHLPFFNLFDPEKKNADIEAVRQMETSFGISLERLLVGAIYKEN